VACIADADARSLSELAAERQRLRDAAEAATLTAAELTDTTFTISNLGPFGVTRFSALVNPPQVAVLAVPSTTPLHSASASGEPMGVGLCLSLSCDHRALDGTHAAAFLADLAQRLEYPSTIRNGSHTHD
jgi:pyruvate dehydrogenase E2 component (dihydrolipoyllysine-residue acetyltransferase)